MGGHIGLVVDAVTEVMMVEGEKIEDATTIGSKTTRLDQLRAERSTAGRPYGVPQTW